MTVRTMCLPIRMLHAPGMGYEKLRVFQAAEELRREVDKLREHLKPGFENTWKHLDEAVDSIPNNLAEGAESIYPAKRRSFYDIAANSSREVRRNLRALDRRKALKNGHSVFRPVVLTLAIDKMIAALIRSLPED